MFFAINSKELAQPGYTFDIRNLSLAYSAFPAKMLIKQSLFTVSRGSSQNSQMKTNRKVKQMAKATSTATKRLRASHLPPFSPPRRTI
jgi:hypothetical protein